MLLYLTAFCSPIRLTILTSCTLMHGRFELRNFSVFLRILGPRTTTSIYSNRGARQRTNEYPNTNELWREPHRRSIHSKSLKLWNLLSAGWNLIWLYIWLKTINSNLVLRSDSVVQIIYHAKQIETIWWPHSLYKILNFIFTSLILIPQSLLLPLIAVNQLSDLQYKILVKMISYISTCTYQCLEIHRKTGKKRHCASIILRYWDNVAVTASENRLIFSIARHVYLLSDAKYLNVCYVANAIFPFMSMI